MLKVYSINRGIRQLVETNNNIYDVVEGFDYVLEYESNNVLGSTIFIEDIPISTDDIEMQNQHKIKTIRKKFFID